MAAYAADLPAKAAAGVPRYQPPQTLNFWAQGFGDFGHSGSDGNAAALSRSTDGFVIGGDASVIGLAGGDWRFGAVGGYTFDSLTVDQRLSSGNFQSVFAGIYGGASFGAVQLRSGAIYGVNSTATSRQIIFPGFDESATSNYGGSTTQAFGEAGYRVGFTGFNLAGLTFSRAMLEPFLERPRSTFTRTDSPRPAELRRSPGSARAMTLPPPRSGCAARPRSPARCRSPPVR